MSILVTGGAGFIGSNFIHEWFEVFDEQVINLDKLTYAANLVNLKHIEPSGFPYIFVEGDIGDTNLVDSLLEKYRIRAIINFAAESHVDRSIEAPDVFFQTNVIGTARLLHSAQKYWTENKKKLSDGFKFLHVSTDEVYGDLEASDSAFTELNPYMPNSPYSASKASSDHIVRSYNKTYGLPIIISNCSNNYGPYQFPEKLIPLIISNALNEEVLPIYGDGNQIRDWLHVKDHCTALIAILSKGEIGESYNIGGNAEKKNLDLVNLICDFLDELRPWKDLKSYKDQIVHVADRLGHDRRYAVNSSKLEKTLFWERSETFDSGIKKTVNWYLDNYEWLSDIQQRNSVK